MRCAQAARLVDAYVDGRLATAKAAALEEHAGSCARCVELVRLARGLREALAAVAPVKAPRGFADGVMAEVYREALRGPPSPRAVAVPRGVSGQVPARVYRRLGLSFVITAGLLAASLIVPRAAYTGLLGTDGRGAAFARGGAAVVREALAGADNGMRGVLQETRPELGQQGNGGNTK